MIRIISNYFETIVITPNILSKISSGGWSTMNPVFILTKQVSRFLVVEAFHQRFRISRAIFELISYTLQNQQVYEHCKYGGGKGEEDRNHSRNHLPSNYKSHTDWPLCAFHSIRPNMTFALQSIKCKYLPLAFLLWTILLLVCFEI